MHGIGYQWTIVTNTSSWLKKIKFDYFMLVFRILFKSFEENCINLVAYLLSIFNCFNKPLLVRVNESHSGYITVYVVTSTILYYSITLKNIN